MITSSFAEQTEKSAEVDEQLEENAVPAVPEVREDFSNFTWETYSPAHLKKRKHSALEVQGDDGMTISNPLCGNFRNFFLFQIKPTPCNFFFFLADAGHFSAKPCKRKKSTDDSELKNVFSMRAKLMESQKIALEWEHDDKKKESLFKEEERRKESEFLEKHRSLLITKLELEIALLQVQLDKERKKI